jgi:hypothetical protein
MKKEVDRKAAALQKIHEKEARKLKKTVKNPTYELEVGQPPGSNTAPDTNTAPPSSDAGHTGFAAPERHNSQTPKLKHHRRPGQSERQAVRRPINLALRSLLLHKASSRLNKRLQRLQGVVHRRNQLVRPRKILSRILR